MKRSPLRSLPVLTSLVIIVLVGIYGAITGNLVGFLGAVVFFIAVMLFAVIVIRPLGTE